MTAAPRLTCPRCERPVVTCYCEHLPTLSAHTRLVLLQHRRERDRAIGTARMATLCLPDASLHVGIDFEHDADVQALLHDPARPAYLLYPTPGAIDVDREPPEGPITLVVVDGTWSQAKKLVRINPSLASLPRLAFTPRTPSDYRIRREPHIDYVSTIEAIAHVLGALERDPDRFAPMLAPFRAMVDTQIDHEQRLAQSRHRRARPAKDPARGLPQLLRHRPDDLLYVAAEANAWPRRLRSADDDELVQWLAYRPSTGERFEALAAPHHGLTPNTARHIDLPAETLRAAPPLAHLLAAWRDFVRPTDVICSWGIYGLSLLARAGGVVPEAHLDLRVGASAWLHRRVGLIEQLAALLEVSSAPPIGQGRGGRRLALLAAAGQRMAAIGRGEAPAPELRAPKVTAARLRQRA